MRTSESIAVGYFAYLLVAAALFNLPPRRRARLVLRLIATLVAIVAIAGRAPSVVRDWAPGVYLLLGYWLPGMMDRGPSLPIERWLVAGDDRLFASFRLGVLVERAPRVVLEGLELSYLMCYPMVPAGFAVLYAAGRQDQADRFWTTVMLSVFACYGALPWIPSRPPRALEKTSAIDRRAPAVRAINRRLLDRASIGVNTFPSGHVAGSIATALVVAASLPLAGILLGLLAASIAAASVLGRYHYAADAVLGALVALVAFLVWEVIG